MPTETEKFLSWYNQQREEGLIDIKFYPGPRASNDSDQEEFFKELNEAISARDTGKIVERSDVF